MFGQLLDASTMTISATSSTSRPCRAGGPSRTCPRRSTRRPTTRSSPVGACRPAARRARHLRRPMQAVAPGAIGAAPDDVARPARSAKRGLLPPTPSPARPGHAEPGRAAPPDRPPLRRRAPSRPNARSAAMIPAGAAAARSSSSAMAPPEPAAASTGTSKLSSKIWRPASLTPRSTCDSTISKLAAPSSRRTRLAPTCGRRRPGTCGHDRARSHHRRHQPPRAVARGPRRRHGAARARRRGRCRSLARPRTQRGARDDGRRTRPPPRPARAAEPLLGRVRRPRPVAEVHAGAGGTDAQDWAEMSACACTALGRARGFSVEVDEATPGQRRTLSPRSSCAAASPTACSHRARRAPTGPHVAVRRAARRQTSFASLDVVPFLDDVSDEWTSTRKTCASTPTVLGAAAST